MGLPNEALKYNVMIQSPETYCMVKSHCHGDFTFTLSIKYCCQITILIYKDYLF